MPAPPKGLVGRAAELDSLLDALRSAADGRPGTVIVSGEAGIGKTRIVEELLRSADTAGFLVVLGNCSPVSGTLLPYGPVVDLLADLLRGFPELPASVPAEVWRSVAWLTDSPGTVDDGGAQVSSGDFAATRLFGGFVELLAIASRRKPILLALEDIHWADPASVDLIVFATRKLRRDRILLVLTNRPPGPGGTVRGALTEIRRLPNTTDVTLGPLSDSVMMTLLEQLPSRPSADVCEQIRAVCDGVPFFALHLAQHSQGRVIPPGLRDILLSSLDDLSADQRALLILLSILGETHYTAMPFASDRLSLEHFDRLVRGLVGRDLLVPREGSIAFRHALLREVTVADTLPSERIIAHSRAAAGLLTTPPAYQAANSAEIAHHLLESNQPAKALRFTVAAARQAAEVWAFADARTLYAQARLVVQTTGGMESTTDVSYPALLREAAIASQWCGELDEALALLNQAQDVVGSPAALRIDIEHTRGRICWAAGNMGEALSAYQRAEALLPDTDDDQLRATVLAALAQGLMATGNALRAEQTARAAIEFAARAGAGRERVHASITLAAARAQLGDVTSAVSGLRECLATARQLDDLELVVRAYGNLTFALGVDSRYDEVAAVAAEGIEVCRRYGPVVSVASNMVSNQVSALIALGRWDEATAVAQDALKDIATGGGALYLRIRLAELAVARGDTVEADEQLAQAQALADFGNPYTLASLATVRAERALGGNDPQAALAAVTEVLPTLQQQDDAVPLLEVCWLGLRAMADTAETTSPLRRAGSAGPEELLDIARRAYQRTQLSAAAALYLACRAEAARVTGSDTEEQWNEAASANGELNRPDARAYGLFRLGAVQLRRRARSAAAITLGEALRLAQTLGAAPLVREITGLGAISGLSLNSAEHRPVQTPAGSAADDYRLTGREREVLVLMVKGATNRVIGRSLYISERTAGVHVSNILAKLGAANRTEAARIAVRLNLDS